MSSLTWALLSGSLMCCIAVSIPRSPALHTRWHLDLCTPLGTWQNTSNFLWNARTCILQFASSATLHFCQSSNGQHMQPVGHTNLACTKQICWLPSLRSVLVWAHAMHWLAVNKQSLIVLPLGMQERGEAYRRRHSSSNWPETQYVLGDEEQLPLEPGSVDCEYRLDQCQAYLNFGTKIWCQAQDLGLQHRTFRGGQAARSPK